MMRLLTLLPLMALVGALSFSATACQPEDSDIDDDSAMVTVAFTDAASDELESFEVEITSVRLRRANGALTTVMQTPVVIDLVTLSDLSEILRVLELPVAWYVGGDITFNWNSAKARIRGELTDAALLDSNGNALSGSSTIDLGFGALGVVLSGGRHRVLEFDFDLDRSVFVDATQNELTVAPSIVVRWDRNDLKTLITVGEILDVSIGQSSFETTIQRPNRPSIGSVECAISSSTVFQINGTPYIGATGLTELNALGLGARVQTYGFVSPTSAAVQVTYVEAGVGAWGGPTAVVQGTVTSRTGGVGADPTLTVRGRSASATGRAFMLNTDFTVHLDHANTRVIRRAERTTRDSDSINVGQAITVYGNLSGTTMTATTPTDLVRMNPVRIYGFANGGASNGNVSINLVRIWLRNVNVFDFDVSGSTQATPTSFTVGISGLSGAGVSAGTAMEFRGFFPAVDASGADFSASSLTNLDLTPYGVRIRYPLITTGSSISAISPSEIELDTSNAVVAVYDKILLGTNPLPTDSPRFRTKAGFTIYAILRQGSISIFLDFSAFARELEAFDALGSRIFTFGAIGDLNLTSNITNASLIIVTMT